MSRLCTKCNVNERQKRSSMCNHCRYLHEKETDPIGQAYRRLKSHAKQRGKEFTITKEEFSQFCVKSEYLQRKGIQKECYHIDRIDEMKGYSLDNIQVLTNSENIKKYCKWVSRDENGKCKFTTQIKIDMKNYHSDTPF